MTTIIIIVSINNYMYIKKTDFKEYTNFLIWKKENSKTREL